MGNPLSLHAAALWFSLSVPATGAGQVADEPLVSPSGTADAPAAPAADASSAVAPLGPGEVAHTAPSQPQQGTTTALEQRSAASTNPVEAPPQLDPAAPTSVESQPDSAPASEATDGPIAIASGILTIDRLTAIAAWSVKHTVDGVNIDENGTTVTLIGGSAETGSSVAINPHLIPRLALDLKLVANVCLSPGRRAAWCG